MKHVPIAFIFVIEKQEVNYLSYGYHHPKVENSQIDSLSIWPNPINTKRELEIPIRIL
jgi:hypothetical protein